MKIEQKNFAINLFVDEILTERSSPLDEEYLTLGRDSTDDVASVCPLRIEFELPGVCIQARLRSIGL